MLGDQPLSDSPLRARSCSAPLGRSHRGPWHGLVAGLLLVTTLPALAEVRVVTRDDGRKIIVNESSGQRAQRLSTRLTTLTAGSEIARLIDIYARHHGLSSRLVQAIVQVESGYNPRALSSKGAKGLMQLMPETAAELGVADAYDPEDNLRGGTRYLRQQIDRFGDLRLALAAYNAGPGAVTRYDGIPPYRETQRYVEKILALYGNSAPGHLQEHARDQARQRHLDAARRHAEEQQQRGEKVYLTRGEGNRIVFTTRPPKRGSDPR